MSLQRATKFVVTCLTLSLSLQLKYLPELSVERCSICVFIFKLKEVNLRHHFCSRVKAS